MKKYSFLNIFQLGYIEELYNIYLTSPNLIDSSWKYFFKGFDLYKLKYNKKLKNFKDFNKKLSKEFKVLDLINEYKYKGHLYAKTNPINKYKKKLSIEIDNFKLSKNDLKKNFYCSKYINFKSDNLKDIIKSLNKIYCKSIGIEYMHLKDSKIIKWIELWIYKNNNQPNLSENIKKCILSKLNNAIILEKFMHKKFIGEKRFSIEGNESIIPGINELIKYSCQQYNVEEFVIGMSHRGRINVLSNILGKNIINIFNEFSQNTKIKEDLIYHSGYTIDLKTKKNNLLKINLMPNPSHLESVNPIVQGFVKSKIENYYSGNMNKVIPLIIHGDAAISAQGVVYETLQMSNLKGYNIGGIIHIIINNQIGFTTDPIDARSSFYCTDIAKIIESPIMHVNANDVEAVVHALYFSIDFRMKYKKDVFIDLLGYRKHGHSEGDEPRFTHSSLYKEISNYINTKDIYKKKLLFDRIININFLEKIENKYINFLNDSYNKYKKLEIYNNLYKSNTFNKKKNNTNNYTNYKNIFNEINTSFSKEKLIYIGKKINTLPYNENFHEKLKKIMFNRYNMILNNNIDWGIAELLSYSSLLYEGYNIRLSGQDVERGTFSHRHIVINSENEKKFILLNNINNNQGEIKIYNSLLSEYGVLGFDYGYSILSSKTLTIWEAQFGDFSNGAQIIIDQYISSAEEKWKIQNGIVLLLPHGYEGQGSEHSSSRIERYLQLCANYNILIANCTTPSNFYHILRRQMKFKIRKPLIIFTPKSLLRDKKCISRLEELSDGKFEDIIDDLNVFPNEIEKLVFCSGKIYYDLLNKKKYINDKKTALIRIEQLYPINIKYFNFLIKRYLNMKYLIWAQEEPENMGAWAHINRFLNQFPWKLISPKESAAISLEKKKDYEIIKNKLIEKIFMV